MVWNPLSRFGRSADPAPPPDAVPEAPAPVAGRHCGGCTECCKVPTIVELKKPPGVLCEHCQEGVGCRIYDSRPPVCRAFLCGWRHLEVLEDAWRPDRCGIIVSFTHEHVPARYAPHAAIQFELFRDARTTITWQPFVAYLIELVRNGMPVLLQVPSEPGIEPSRLFLSDMLMTSAALRDYGRMLLDLAQALALCESFAKKPVVLE
jgi:hypothetical protein